MVDAQDPLVVTGVAVEAHIVVALPEAPSAMLADDFVEPINDGSVVFGIVPEFDPAPKMRTLFDESFAG